MAAISRTPGLVEQNASGHPHADVCAVSGRKIATTWGVGYQPKTREQYLRRTEEDRANARHIVACWNACEGFTTEELETIAEWKAACRASDNARAHAIEPRAARAIERFKNQAGAALMQNEHDACTECGSFDCNGECMGDGLMGG